MTINRFACLGMDRSRIRQSKLFGEHYCPVECLAKAFLFIIVTTVVLYVPLGELGLYCDPSTCAKSTLTTLNGENAAVCCLCDLFKVMLHIGRATQEGIDLLLYATLDLLYEAKLQFYQILEKVDRNDLCRSVCCRDISNANNGQEKRSCRCPKHKTCKYKTVQ